jgi:hypothetical protein
METSIRDLLARLLIPGLKESHDRHLIAEVLTNELKITFKPANIRCTEGTVFVSTPPVVKSALKLHEQKLLNQLAEKGISALRIV